MKELEWHPWASVDAAGSAERIPRALLALRDAETPEEANKAYWQIDNTAVVQGYLHEAAKHVIPCALEVLLTCTDAARPRVLELLFQLGGGCAGQETDPSYLKLKRECLAEVRHGVAFYFHYLETGSNEEREACIDLIELCATDDLPLSVRSLWWFEQLLATTDDRRLTKWLSDAVAGMRLRVVSGTGNSGLQ